MTTIHPIRPGNHFQRRLAADMDRLDIRAELKHHRRDHRFGLIIMTLASITGWGIIGLVGYAVLVMTP